MINEDLSSKPSPSEDLNELSALVPKELERVQKQRDQVEQELASLQSLQKIISNEMLAGVEMLDRKKDQPTSEVWNVMTSFRINMDQERANIIKEQDKLKTQLS
jgi:hypothetical protein